LDPFGNVDSNYAGTLTFATTDPDPGVVLPADYTFTPADGGVHTFTDTGLGETTLVTAGDQAVTVTDTADGTINGTATVTVTSATAIVPGLAAARRSAEPSSAPAPPMAQLPFPKPFDGQPAWSESVPVVVRRFTTSYVQDVIFAGTGDLLIDALAADLLRHGW
jgi:hypothetical protein